MPVRAGLTLGLALGAWLLGCGGEPPRLAPLPRVEGPLATPARTRALLEALRDREDAIPSWKAVHTLELEDRKRGRSVSLRGVLLVLRPDRFRLRLIGPAGITAMDLTYCAPRFRLELPGQPPIARENAEAEERIPVAAMAEAFLRRYGGEALELRTGRGLRRLTIRGPDGRRRAIFLPTGALEPRFDSFRGGGEESLRVTYGDYRAVAGHRLPFEIRMDLPARKLTARVTVERYEIGPETPAEAFEIAP